MPTKLKRVSVALDDEVQKKLEELAANSQRSISNMVVVLLEGSLFPGGRVKPVKSKSVTDLRGGSRANAGRKPKNADKN